MRYSFRLCQSSPRPPSPAAVWLHACIRRRTSAASDTQWRGGARSLAACGFLCRFSLSRLGLETRLLVERDVCVHGHGGNGLADDRQRKIIDGLEAHARLAHVELLSLACETVTERLRRRRVAVHAHEIEGAVILLRGEAGVAQRVSIVRLRIPAERHVIVDHAVLDSLDVTAREVAKHHVPHGTDGRAPLRGKPAEILLDRWRLGGGHVNTPRE